MKRKKLFFAVCMHTVETQKFGDDPVCPLAGMDTWQKSLPCVIFAVCLLCSLPCVLSVFAVRYFGC